MKYNNETITVKMHDKLIVWLALPAHRHCVSSINISTSNFVIFICLTLMSSL